MAVDSVAASSNSWRTVFDYTPDYLYVMPYHVKQPLCTILDNTDDVKHNWQVLVKAVKKYPISGSVLNEVHRHSDPASVILDYYSSNLMTVDELYSYLASIHNIEACQELLNHYHILFAVQPRSKPIRIHRRGSITLECQAHSNEGVIRYQWYRDGISLQYTNSKLEILNGDYPSNGEYLCIVTNGMDMRRSRSSYIEFISESVNAFPSDYEDDDSDCDSLASSGPKDEPQFPSSIPHAAESGRDYHQKLPQFAEIPSKEDEAEYGYYDPSPHMATAKVALILCNQNYLYHRQKLTHCFHDALVMSKQLTELGFKVITLTDVTLEEAKAAFAMMNKVIIKDCYVFIYMVGHGLTINNTRFFSPIDAKPEIVDPRQHLGIPDALRFVARNDPKWIILLCDACASRAMTEGSGANRFENNLPDVGRNVFLAYSSNFKAYESGLDNNGVYIKHLKKYLTQIEMPITEIFEDTNRDVEKEFPNQQPDFIDNMRDKQLSLFDDVMETAEPTPSDRFWDQLHDYQIEPRISIREPKLEIEATLSYDEFYDALLTLRVKYMENVNYCDVHVVGFRTNVEDDNGLVQLERVRVCPIDKQQGFVPNLIINSTGFINLRKIRGTSGILEVVIYTGKYGGQCIRRCLPLNISPICIMRNWTNFEEFREVRKILWDSYSTD